MIIGGKYIGFFLMEGKIMANKAETLKKLMAVSSAMLVAGAMIMATPITAFADVFEDPNPAGETIYIINEGQELNENQGDVYTNQGTVTSNNGKINNNFGQVTNNYEIIQSNGNTIVGSGEYIYGTVVNNCPNGVIQRNNGIVDNNQEGAEVTKNSHVIETNNGYVLENTKIGSVNINNGKVKLNYGSVDVNKGEVTTNFYEVKTNDGFIKSSSGSSTVLINNYEGTVENNYGRIEKNLGIIEKNDNGVVDDNQGTINVSYDGTIGGNKAEHQFWSVNIDGTDDILGIALTYDYSNSDFLDETRYLEQAEGKTGILRIAPREDGNRIAQGSGTPIECSTCHYELTQDGNDYVLTITSITGQTLFTLEQLNLIVEAIQQQGDIEPIGPAGGGTASGGTVTVVVDDSITVVPSEGGSQSSGSSSSEAPAGAITISLPRTNAATAVATAGPSVLGANREAARAISLKMSKLTDAQYKDAVIKNLSATPAGGLFRLETDRISCFDRAMLEAFAKSSNVDMEVLFPLGGKKLSVMIPAGTDINKLLDNKGYCGFLRLLAILGGEIITK